MKKIQIGLIIFVVTLFCAAPVVGIGCCIAEKFQTCDGNATKLVSYFDLAVRHTTTIIVCKRGSHWNWEKDPESK